MNYAERLKQRASHQLDQLSGKSANADKYVKMPEGKNGIMSLRILPPANENDDPWFVCRTHKINDKIFHCPRDQQENGYWKGDCPICEYYSELWKLSDSLNNDDDKNKVIELARSIKPLLKVYYNAIVRSQINSKTGEVEMNVGPKVLTNGQKLHTKVLSEIGDQECNITDLKDGKDFKIIKKTVGGFPNYDDSKFLDVSVAGTKEEMKQWMSNLWNLKEERKLVSVEELRKQVDIFKGVKEDDETSSSFKPVAQTAKKEVAPFGDDEEPVVKKPEVSKSVSKPPVTKVVDNKKSKPVEDDDIDVSIVGEDFMDDIDRILKG